MTIAEPFLPLWQEAGFKQPTLIQQAVAAPLQAGQSVVGLAPTGSGKTLAFGLPLLASVTPGVGLQVMVLAPSQELAIQIRDVLQPYAQAVGLKLIAITGNANVKRQLTQLQAKPEVVVGTAGRLLELLQAGRLKGHKLRTLVVDEADELLREPGLTQVRAIAQAAPGALQLALFSATDSAMLRQVPQWFGVTPTVFDVRAEDRTQGTVQHLFIQTDNAHREGWLRALAHLDDFKALVFFNNNATMEKVAGILRHQAVKFAVLARGDRSVNRANALAAFKKGKVTLLLVTDLAGRGLDLKKLPAVINYQSPKRDAAYIHRAGRTGRMGAAGYVLTLGDDHDLRDLKKLVPQYGIVRGYLVDGGLTTTKPQALPDAPVKPAPTPKVPPATTPVKPKVKHKKKRQRDLKNKGKRKPAKSKEN